METRVVKGAPGIALLSVMIVIASVSATASWLLYRQHIDIQRTTQVLSREQAFLFALAAEDFARDILAREAAEGDDQQRNNFYATKIGQGQWWSRAGLFNLINMLGGKVFEGVSEFNMKIYDLQGFFDLNSLRKSDPACNAQVQGVTEQLQPHQWSLRVFAELLKPSVRFSEPGTLERDITPAVLRDSLLDWLDADDALRTHGAEDAFYSLSGIPYHSANSPFAMVRELYFVRGFRDLPRQQFDDLARLLVALPLHSGCPEKINVLSAPVALVESFIRAVPHVKDPGRSATELKEALCEPPIATDKELQSALKRVLLEDIEKQEEQKLITAWVDHVAAKVLGFKSRYFGLHVSFKHRGKKFAMNSLFYLKRQLTEDEESPPVQLLQRYAGPDPYRNLRLHESGTDANCPQDPEPPIDEEEL